MLGRVFRLILPVTGLLTAYALAYATRAMPVAVFDDQALLGQAGLFPSDWLRVAHLAIMLAFFVVILTNRVYGPAYALLQLLLAWGIACAVYLFALPDLNRLLHQDGTLPAMPVLLTFLGALATAHLFSIILFDNFRGRPWWRAPLMGGLAGAAVLALVYWPTLYFGLDHATGAGFVSQLTLDLALKTGVAFVLLAPYALLRPLARPRDGFGGY